MAFISIANNLVTGDTNSVSDVFLHDLQTGQTSRVSVSSNGTQANNHSGSYGISISADGRFVAFASDATNLAGGQIYLVTDVFVHDRVITETTRVSVSSSGEQGNSVSFAPSISSDGRYVAFESSATNLVSGDTNGQRDVFVHDRQTGQTTRVSLRSDGTQGVGGDGSYEPSISADGRYVAFWSNIPNLVAGDTNNQPDVFVHDRQTGQTTRVSIAANGTQGVGGGSVSPSISSDGRYVAFESSATNLVSGDTNGQRDVFVHDRQTGQTTRVSVASDGSQANNAAMLGSISADGCYVAFWSLATNLATGDTNNYADAFVHDQRTGQTTRVSLAFDGAQGNGGSYPSSISDDGRYVTFESDASNLVSGDTNSQRDTFVRDRGDTAIQACAISGHVETDSGDPVAGVTITASSGRSTMTGPSGVYTITGFITGTHTITPTLSGYRFAPVTRTVDMSNTNPLGAVDMSNTNPIGAADFIARPAVPTPFLDPPIKDSAVGDALRGSTNGGGTGRVNAWFDHSSPIYTGDTDNLVRNFKGTPVPGACNFGGPGCYNGHSGTDFNKATGVDDNWIVAAAGGIVTDVVRTDNGGYGVHLWIDHENGYATLYGHLRTGSIPTSFTNGTRVTPGQQLGIMGNTGRVVRGKGDGTHLHFGLYYDVNGDRHWTEFQAPNEVVDPFGWMDFPNWPSPPDPWSVPSFYLWNYRGNSQTIVGSLGATLSSPSGTAAIVVPPGALTSTITLDIWDVPPAGASGQLRSTGRSFWLRVLEWLFGGSVNGSVSIASPSFAQPITITVTYSDTETLHLDESRLAIYHWNESGGAWMALPTTVDIAQNQAVAHTTEIGNFELQGQLLCPVDVTEPDDNFYAATTIASDGTAAKRLFDVAQDEDWFALQGMVGGQYAIQTRGLSSVVDTIIQLYDQDGITVLASDDNGGGEAASRIVWNAPLDGTYFIRVFQASGSAYGCSAEYELSVTQVDQPIEVAVAGPAIGYVNTGYAFTATVTPVTATLPIIYIWQATGQMPLTNTLNSLSNTVSFSWSDLGTKTITVTGANAGGLVTGTANVLIIPQTAIIVTTDTDELNANGNCSLREAIRAANTDTAVDACSAGSGADTVVVPAGIYTLTILGPNEDAAFTGDLDITDSMTITGAGPALTNIDGGGIDRVFEVLDGSITISGVTIRNGIGYSVQEQGAGIRVNQSSTLVTVTDVVIANNNGAGIESRGAAVIISNTTITGNNMPAGVGGIIANLGELTVGNSTVSNNSGGWGGISADSGFTMRNGTVSGNTGTNGPGGLRIVGGGTIINSTVSGNQGTEGAGIWTNQGLGLINNTVVSNTATGTGSGIFQTGNGGGIYFLGGSGVVTLTNTIIAGNQSSAGSPDCSGPITSLGHNLISSTSGCTFSVSSGDKLNLSPNLGSLSNYGGPTLTHALLPASPAIDGGHNVGCPATDQRGVSRPVDGDGNGSAICDIGAFELVPVPVTGSFRIFLPVAMRSFFSAPACTVYTSTDVPRTIPDHPMADIESSLPVPGAGITISDLTVRMGDLRHTYTADLQIRLVAPNGASILIVDRVGGSGDNFIDMRLNDSYSTPVDSGTAPFTGDFRPDRPLAGFRGLNSSGAWKLRMVDMEGGDTGVLNAWGIEFCP